MEMVYTIYIVSEQTHFVIFFSKRGLLSNIQLKVIIKQFVLVHFMYFEEFSVDSLTDKW